jgi:hypothetical protein
VVNSRKLTTRIAQLSKQKFKTLIPEFLASWRETRKVIAPNSEDKPKTCKNRIASETEGELEKSMPVSG